MQNNQADPYTDSPNNNCKEALRGDHRKLQEDQALHLEVMLLREKFLTQAQALVHGDLHTGSIFDLLLNAAGHEYWSTDEGARKQHRAYLLGTAEAVWTGFESGPGSRPASARCGTSTASFGSHLPLDIRIFIWNEFCRMRSVMPAAKSRMPMTVPN
ncbi:hypothetical protein [Paenibacillus thiaminolyticus]|uniref:hypothetical protein n=1 Tax=Paenibacillus thiaminolyticus TaxID=49283 RepID=UPI0015FF3A50|nr:hypothetical protein [Paenibacillus thiaminolyticus]